MQLVGPVSGRRCRASRRSQDAGPPPTPRAARFRASALDLSITRTQAINTLITAYFHRYGPATISDATWWSGLSATDIRAALHVSGREIVTVATPWSQQLCLMFADQVPNALAHQPSSGIQLLAREDTALKAYHQTRGRYLSRMSHISAFNQIGEAMPAILIDGQITGTWAWNPDSRSIRIRLSRPEVTSRVHAQIRDRASMMTETLRRGWTPARSVGR